MKFISVRDIRSTPARIWKDLPEEQEMIITNNGKPIALLMPVNDSDIEETLSVVRKARAINAVKKMQFFSIQNNLSDITEDDVEKEIQGTRKSRKK
jgi:antitoxin (DNA-binding transcriptional repressor) of toxin-antitoxin stability system